MTDGYASLALTDIQRQRLETLADMQLTEDLLGDGAHRTGHRLNRTMLMYGKRTLKILSVLMFQCRWPHIYAVVFE